METKSRLFFACAILGIYILGLYRRFRIDSKLSIEEIRTNSKYFPKHYSMPPRWIRKHFNLRKAYIPKFILFNLYLAVGCLIVGPLCAIVCLIVKPNRYFYEAMYWTPLGFCAIDMIVFNIMCHFFKKR